MFKLMLNILSPLQLISMGYVIIAICGALLLMMPISSANMLSQSFIDALFTSTSAVSTTGLIVVDTTAHYSTFGELVILALIQIGGLGYMLIFVVFSLMIKNKLSITGKRFLRESLSMIPGTNIFSLIKLTVLYTIIIEITGTLVYFAIWIYYFNPIDAFYYSLFHSVSAFCTAGFSLFSDSLASFQFNWLINLNTIILAFSGSIGFFVLNDISIYIRNRVKRNPINKLTLHSKVVLTTTLSLFLAASLLILIFENSKHSSNFIGQILTSTFQTITASTTVGFNTVDIGQLTTSSLFLIIILMFIGGSPGSTAGGIKTTSFAVFSKSVISTLKREKNVTLLGRTINSSAFHNSSAQIYLGAISIVIITLCLTITERQDFIKILFESVSAFGTVGLSTGITGSLSIYGKTLIIIMMMIGRIGPLAIGISLLYNKNGKNYSYPEEEILIS